MNYRTKARNHLQKQSIDVPRMHKNMTTRWTFSVPGSPHQLQNTGQAASVCSPLMWAVPGIFPVCNGSQPYLGSDGRQSTWPKETSPSRLRHRGTGRVQQYQLISAAVKQSVLWPTSCRGPVIWWGSPPIQKGSVSADPSVNPIMATRKKQWALTKMVIHLKQPGNINTSMIASEIT